MIKKLVAMFALILSSIVPANAEELSYLNRVISWEDTSPFHDSPVAFSGSAGTYSPCNGGWSASCDPNTGDIMVVNFLPICATSEGTDKRVDCLEGVSVDLKGSKISGERILNQISTWDMYEFTAKPEFGIAASSPPLVYKFPGLTHTRGDLFMVSAFSTKFVKKGIAGEAKYTFFIAPTFQENGKFNCERLKTPGGLCWISGSFLNDTKFTLDLKLATAPSGWFSSRIALPDIKMNLTSGGRSEVSFTGVSQAIPSINRNFSYTNQIEKDQWDQIASVIPVMPWDKLTAEGKRYSSSTPYNSDSIDAFQTLVSKLPSFDNADAFKNIWRMETNSPVNQSGNQCLKTGLIGVVSSNSMTYQNAIPTWDPTNGTLVYRIASPHSVLGNEFLGRYDLLISEQVAKCLWSLKNLTPIAEINVTSATGDNKVFTASSGVDNGFYKFTAAGFTFSSNKISVKMLSEEKISNVTQNVQTAPKVGLPTVAIKKSTITCLKGKIQKKVTGVTPKCPTGYKKK